MSCLLRHAFFSIFETYSFHMSFVRCSPSQVTHCFRIKDNKEWRLTSIPWRLFSLTAPSAAQAARVIWGAKGESITVLMRYPIEELGIFIQSSPTRSLRSGCSHAFNN